MRRSTSSCNGLLANSVSTKCIGGDALMGTSTVSALSGASALSKSILDLLARLFEIAGPFVAATFRPEVGIANGASRRLLRSSPQNLEEVLRLIFHRHAEPSSFTYRDIRPWRTLKSPSIIVFSLRRAIRTKRLPFCLFVERTRLAVGIHDFAIHRVASGTDRLSRHSEDDRRHDETGRASDHEDEAHG